MENQFEMTTAEIETATPKIETLQQRISKLDEVKLKYTLLN